MSLLALSWTTSVFRWRNQIGRIATRVTRAAFNKPSRERVMPGSLYGIVGFTLDVHFDINFLVGVAWSRVRRVGKYVYLKFIARDFISCKENQRQFKQQFAKDWYIVTVRYMYNNLPSQYHTVELIVPVPTENVPDRHWREYGRWQFHFSRQTASIKGLRVAICLFKAGRAGRATRLAGRTEKRNDIYSEKRVIGSHRFICPCMQRTDNYSSIPV